MKAIAAMIRDDTRAPVGPSEREAAVRARFTATSPTDAKTTGAKPLISSLASSGSDSKTDAITLIAGSSPKDNRYAATEGAAK